MSPLVTFTLLLSVIAVQVTASPVRGAQSDNNQNRVIIPGAQRCSDPSRCIQNTIPLFQNPAASFQKRSVDEDKEKSVDYDKEKRSVDEDKEISVDYDKEKRSVDEDKEKFVDYDKEKRSVDDDKDKSVDYDKEKRSVDDDKDKS